MIPLGDFLLHFFRGVTPIVGKAGEAGVEFPLDFVVEFDAKHPVAPTFGRAQVNEQHLVFIMVNNSGQRRPTAD